jgi:hypothetical protein
MPVNKLTLALLVPMLAFALSADAKKVDATRSREFAAQTPRTRRA